MGPLCHWKIFKDGLKQILDTFVTQYVWTNFDILKISAKSKTYNIWVDTLVPGWSGVWTSGSPGNWTLSKISQINQYRPLLVLRFPCWQIVNKEGEVNFEMWLSKRHLNENRPLFCGALLKAPQYLWHKRLRNPVQRIPRRFNAHWPPVRSDLLYLYLCLYLQLYLKIFFVFV